MTEFVLNGRKVSYTGDSEKTLLEYLREDCHLTAAKDGCSGEGICGACTVEIDGKAKLACKTKMKQLNGAQVQTLEGIPEDIINIIATIFVNNGAVQCGFCTPGFVSRTKILLQENPNPTIEEIRQAIKPHLCRCTGYKKIERAIAEVATTLSSKQSVKLDRTQSGVGKSAPKYEALEAAKGTKKYTDDLFFPGMKYAALLFSEYPKAKVRSIDTREAKNAPGVIRVFTASDIPGDKIIGLIRKDQYVMISEGESTHYIGDVIAAVVADSEALARQAVKKIKVDYEPLEPVTDVFKAIDGALVHDNTPNLISTTSFKVGFPDAAFQNAAFIARGRFETQRVEHAFLEKECAVAHPDSDGGVTVYSQGQGVYVDQKQIAAIISLPLEKVRVKLLSNGGGFGGKEDLSVQGFAAWFAHALQLPVKVRLTRQESIRMHPKRHPVFMDMELAADKTGKLTALRLRAVGDTGAYASVGEKVMERVAGHATAGYFIPNIDIEAKTVYTNNIPSGAMRGFGANQVAFALETCIDDICYQAGFDRWKFRYDNALEDGLSTATGQKVFGVGIKACLEAVKEEFYKAKYAGLACAIKNSGVGNGMIDESKVVIEIVSQNCVRILHGWTEMGQGVHTIATQTLCEETGIPTEIIQVEVNTKDGIETGMTTSSRATALLGLAIIDACRQLKEDLRTQNLSQLSGKKYFGQYICDWTTKPGTPNVEQKTHYSYGYAVQLCILNKDGEIEKIVAAHDGGKIYNPTLFEGQVEGGVHMGLGYALRESLPMKDGYLNSDKMADLRILRAHETPEIKVIPIEVPDPVGPYGAKGVGEIGLVPTAAAVACALYNYTGIRPEKLPLRRNPSKT